MNNRIDPALFSPAAVNLAKRLPSTTDPCGLIAFDVQSNKDEAQTILRIDHQLSTDHSFFGRYMASHFTQEPGYAGGSDSILKTNVVGADDMVHSFTLGQTSVLSSSMVNALRFAVNKVKVDNYQNQFFSPRDIGANIYSYLPGYMSLTITGGFTMYRHEHECVVPERHVSGGRGPHDGQREPPVRCRRQRAVLGKGTTHRRPGQWQLDLRWPATGLGLADLMVGRVTSVEHGGLGKLPVNSWYVGVYAQDSWRVSSRVTINGGVRWEPFFGQNVENGVNLCSTWRTSSRV